MRSKVTIKRLATAVPGLDRLLGGGLPDLSFNIIVGTPGSGKTTLGHQIMFALATPECPALFFTAMGEPALKMLRYQQQFSFFDLKKVDRCIRFINLSDDILEGDYDKVLSRMSREVQNHAPRLVFVDSFRSIVQATGDTAHGGTELQLFVHRLVQQMTSWQATTFLIGEYSLQEAESNPIFTVADGTLRLSQNLLRNSMVRKIQVIKMRGQAHMAGLHTFRIDNDGVKIFPRAFLEFDPNDASQIAAGVGEKRLSMGVKGLDEMMGGGLPVGYSLLLVGPSGSGKTILATEFLAEGVRRGEPGIVAAFEKSPNRLLSHKLNKLVMDGKVGVIDTHALDLSLDETLYDMVAMIEKMQAKRVVMDSLSGFELALAPEFREDYRESLYRMVSVLTAMGVSILMTAELEDRYTDLRFSSYGNAFLADAIIVQRYVQIAGQLRRVMSVVKVRGSNHSKDIRFFEIAEDTVTIGETLSEYDGILSGQPDESGRGRLPAKRTR
jgi:circadian clock protein KaiC